MARLGRLAALAALTLTAAPLERAFAVEAGAPVAVAARLSQDQGGAKLVFDLSRTVDASASALASPDRIVVDMPEVSFRIDPSVGQVGALRDDSVVKDFRFGLLAAGKSRIVIDLARTGLSGRGFHQTDRRWRARGAAYDRTEAVRSLRFCCARPRRRPSRPQARPMRAAPAQPPVIVLDPGHGGIDSGASGLGGVQEKTLVYEFCAELKRQLDATKRYTSCDDARRRPVCGSRRSGR